jgi:hypothetical protein
MRFSRLQLSDSFVKPSQEEYGVLLELPDAFRFYNYLDDETDPLCNGEDLPDTTLNLGVTECQTACEEKFDCTGVLAYIDDDYESQCDMCLQGRECAFDCSTVSNSIYFKPESNFFYASLHGCPKWERRFDVLKGATLEECKMYCSYYKTCEGFRVDFSDESFECELLAELDFESDCDEKEEIYIPFVPKGTKGFLPVEGELVHPVNMLTTHAHLTGSDECSAACSKTLDCGSFIMKDNNCSLYMQTYFRNTNEETGLHISVSLSSHFSKSWFYLAPLPSPIFLFFVLF